MTKTPSPLPISGTHCVAFPSNPNSHADVTSCTGRAAEPTLSRAAAKFAELSSGDVYARAIQVRSRHLLPLIMGMSRVRIPPPASAGVAQRPERLVRVDDLDLWIQLHTSTRCVGSGYFEIADLRGFESRLRSFRAGVGERPKPLLRSRFDLGWHNFIRTSRCEGPGYFSSKETEPVPSLISGGLASGCPVRKRRILHRIKGLRVQIPPCWREPAGSSNR